MARTPRNYAIQTQLSTSAVDIVDTVVLNTTANIRKLSFFNTSTTVNRTVTVYAVPSGGTAGTTNEVAVKAIPPRKMWNCIEVQGESLTDGMKLQAIQDAGTDVNANCSGADIT